MRSIWAAKNFSDSRRLPACNPKRCAAAWLATSAGLRSPGDAKSDVAATAKLERFGSGGASEAREAIVYEGPVGAVVEVEVRFGVSVDRAFHVGKNDVDVVGVGC